MSPKLWNETIDAHRRSVRDATLDATADLVREHGLTSVTMSQIAARAGIGRATLYKYFPDVETIVVAWHERQVGRHVTLLAEVRDRSENPRERLQEVLTSFARLVQHSRDVDPTSFLHRRPHVSHAQQNLLTFLTELVQDAAAQGELRGDVPADELASFCLHAVGAAADVSSEASVRRLVTVTLDALSRQPAAAE